MAQTAVAVLERRVGSSIAFRVHGGSGGGGGVVWWWWWRGEGTTITTNTLAHILVLYILQKLLLLSLSSFTLHVRGP